MANKIITAEQLRDLGADLTELLEAYELTREERIMALLSAACGEASVAGLTVGQLKDRFARCLVECHQLGLRFADQRLPPVGSNGTS